jgi:nitrate/nitrite transport system ATP-binding protein
VALLEAQGLAKSFATAGGTRQVLRDVTLSVERGEFLAIVGAMGSGKSTLMHLLTGLTLPDAGRLVIGGDEVRGVRRDAALVFQNHSLLPWFSAIENVRLAVDAAFPDWSKTQQRDQALRTLELVGLGDALHRRPGQLSGGMRQRVAIARAFATEPDILFLDEPFGALDALTRGNLQQDLVSLCADAERPVTAVMITNSVDEALLLSDRIVPMTRGPRAALGASVPVDIQKPRTAAQLLHDEHAVRVRSHVIESLTDSVHRSRRRPGTAREASRRDPASESALPAAGGVRLQPERSEA